MLDCLRGFQDLVSRFLIRKLEGDLAQRAGDDLDLVHKGNRNAQGGGAGVSEDTQNPSVREHLHEQIQSTVALDEELPEGTMLKGWVLVAESVAPDNGAWLTRLSGGPGTIGEDDGLPEWQEPGYLHNALNCGPMFGADEAEEVAEAKSSRKVDTVYVEVCSDFSQFEAAVERAVGRAEKRLARLGG